MKMSMERVDLATVARLGLAMVVVGPMPTRMMTTTTKLKIPIMMMMMMMKVVKSFISVTAFTYITHGQSEQSIKNYLTFLGSCLDDSDEDDEDDDDEEAEDEEAETKADAAAASSGAQDQEEATSKDKK